MAKFSIGEIAIYHWPGNRHHGKEVEILSALMSVRCISESSGAYSVSDCYQITPIFSHSKRSWAEPHELRKKKPPHKEKTGTWTDGNNAWIPEPILETIPVLEVEK